MDTLAFFRAILPEDGVHFLALFRPGEKAPAHKAYTSLESLADAAVKYDRTGQLSVYHACSTYNEACIIEDGRKTYRKPTNWNRAKALWVDIDCGEDKAAKGAGYATKKLAAAALQEFCTKTGFPSPMVIDSGNGIHCYWPLTKAIRPVAWQALSSKLQDVLSYFEVRVDPTCTADFSRILRPVGTFNRKGDPKPVSCKLQRGPFPPEEIRDKLTDLVSTYGITRKQLPRQYDGPPGLNDDLTAHLQHIQIDSSAEEVATKCQQVRLMRDTKGDVSYEHWRGVIGLIKHCTEGIELARAWSEERLNTGHENDDVLTRYTTWNAGPTTCELFAKANPGGCDGCEYKGKIKSPIVLGRVAPKPQPTTLEAVVDGEKTIVEIPEFPEDYAWENGVMKRYVKDKDDILQAHVFCRSLFYPTYRMRKDDGTFGLGFRVHLPDGRTRETEIDTGLLAANQKLLEALGHKAEIVQTNNKDSPFNLAAYVRDSFELLKRKGDEINTMTSFGWKNDLTAFLIGDRLYHEDGTIRKVLLGKYAADNASHFPPPRGTLDGYVNAVNHVYNRPGMIPLQYAFCSGYGSLLTPFGEDMYHGLMVAITGGETARGKTTVCYASMYGFGDAEAMRITGIKGATENARYAQLGTYGNLPVLFDEYTNIDPEDMSTFAYRVSEGKEKRRLGQTTNGGVRQMPQTKWQLSPYVTANRDLHSVLAAHSANSQAEAVRLIQIKIDEYEMHQFPDGEVAAHLALMRLNAGQAGDRYIRHIVQKRDDVIQLFQQTLLGMTAKVPGPRYRYYRNHAAATLTAAKILTELGIIRFDLVQLEEYCVHLMLKLCDEVTETNMLTPEDALSSMINDLSPRILVTVEYRDARDKSGPETPYNRVAAAVAGRYVIGGANKKERLAGKLILSRNEMKNWCSKNRIDLNSVLDYAKAHGVLVASKEKVTLTRGTSMSTVNIWCAILDMVKLEATIDQKLKLVGVANEPGTVDAAAASM